MTEQFEAEIAAAIRKFIGENGVLYYQHVDALAKAIMLPVGHLVSQVRPVVEAEAHKIEATVEEVAEEAKVKAEAAVTAVEAVVTPIKRTQRKKKDADEGTGDRSGS